MALGRATPMRQSAGARRADRADEEYWAIRFDPERALHRRQRWLDALDAHAGAGTRFARRGSAERKALPGWLPGATGRQLTPSSVRAMTERTSVGLSGRIECGSSWLCISSGGLLTGS